MFIGQFVITCPDVYTYDNIKIEDTGTFQQTISRSSKRIMRRLQGRRAGRKDATER